MTTSDPSFQAQKSLLGEILTHITGSKLQSAPISAGEVVLLEREPANLHDPHAIRLKNAAENAIGYLPRSVACWLAPLLDAQKVRIEAYLPLRPGLSQGVKAPSLPVVLSVFIADQAAGLLEKKEIRTKEDVLHQVFYQAYKQAHEFSDPQLIEDLAESLKPLARQKMHPETHLLLALLPGIVNENRTAQGVKQMVHLKDHLTRIRIGEPLYCQNLTFFPLFVPEAKESPYVLLQKAIQEGQATVEEVSESGHVPELKLINRCLRPILIPEGEILVGAKQNRVVNLTVLVAATSEFLVPVSCVEQGRWRYQSKHFAVQAFAQPSLRSKKMRSVQRNREEYGSLESDQGEVWDEVAKSLHDTKAASPTASLTDSYDAQKAKFSELHEEIVLPDQAAGVLVARGRAVLGLDLFDTPQTLAAIWKRLSESYFFEAFRESKTDAPAKDDVARSFLEKVSSSARLKNPPVGLGEEFEIAADGIVGAALLYEGTLCHLAAFAVSE
jgi:hypothetical protein